MEGRMGAFWLWMYAQGRRAGGTAAVASAPPRVTRPSLAAPKAVWCYWDNAVNVTVPA
jgi:hypothetical protein